MVAVGSGGHHHAAAYHGAGLLPASESIITTGFSRAVRTPASGQRSSRPGVLIRSLHDLSAYANSPDSQAAHRKRRAVSPDQRERSGHDRGGGFGRPQDFQQSLVSKNTGVLAGRTSGIIRIRADPRGRPRTGKECRETDARIRDGHNAGISFPPQGWQLACAGIGGQRYPQRKRRAGKIGDRQPRYNGAQEGAGGPVALGSEFPVFGGRGAVRDLPSHDDGSIPGGESSLPENARL